ncbi:hypothetical protein SPRG_08190 [Saprolegnia parasitica CBS 223.65]|uniref:hydroxyacylglutathione hydrolase n=1 Tax=Saprolegnia parasitica (strain CBS 223.65) TaxID=695850 RepID=A0A067CHU6_SAPPC|nr:hypothetical protein SPRG_08190 [Saprolegnia parasitica CBS 223.65]KDO26387.1 hypothetical protein SPRG_08190 [Saprolegnia parasitica CBS 223.65]|eukprot:XP_012202825.1 hypothetical protein SPRG_08190 [Saprolegnia parasitica CBS 223.65]
MAQVVVIPVLSDNYAYLLVDEATKTAAAVDPVEPHKVLDAAKALNVHLTHVLTTHSHFDHDGGNEEMLQLLPHLTIVGGKNDRASAVTHEVDHNDVVRIGALEVRVLYTPCHTPGHVLYLCESNLFTGDTLFIAGCGRFNGGTPAQMHHALNTVVAQLPLDTKVYCGHEYTTNNLAFAAAVEPANKAIAAKQAGHRRRLSRCRRQLRPSSKPTHSCA